MVGLRAGDARARGAAAAAVGRRVRHLRHRRRRRRHVQLSRRPRVVVAACGVPRRQARQPLGVEPLRQRRRLRGARRRRRRAAPAVVERCLDEAGIAFFFAPTFHPSMRHAAPARRELGVRTAFNLLGPLTNPAGARAPGRRRAAARADRARGARAAACSASERAWVVHGADGLDELSTTGYTKVSECRDGAVRTFYVHPADVRPARRPALADLARRRRGATTPRSRARVLAGDAGPARDVVLLNAGAALLVAGAAAVARRRDRARRRRRSIAARRARRSSGWSPRRTTEASA